MPKQAKSILSKVGKICREFNNEFSATPGGELRCNLCEVIVKCEKNISSKAIGRASGIKQD